MYLVCAPLDATQSYCVMDKSRFHLLVVIECICHMLQALIAACEDQNEDSFTDAVREYDSISRLEQWYTTILLRIKKSIEGGDSLR